MKLILQCHINLLNAKKIRDRSTIINTEDKILEFLNFNFNEQHSNVFSPSNEDYFNSNVPDITSSEEVSKLIHANKNTAPGISGVSYAILKNLNDDHMKCIADHFNRTWRYLEIPASWKEFEVVAILKSGRDPNLIANYRPIALGSYIGKIFERIIVNRLYYDIERILPKNSFGFRNGKCTADYITELISKVQHDHN